MTGKTLYFTLIALIGIAMPLLAGCTSPAVNPVPTPTPTPTTPASGMANPAAVYCTQQTGTRYEIRTNSTTGGQYGVCILPGGTQCDEWAYYRGECPAATTTTTGAGIANPSAVFCVEQNFTYQIVTNPDGSQAGNCVFPNGKACDGWAYYRGECNETTAK